MNTRILDMADCTEFGQLFESRPPSMIRVTALALIALTGAAITWSGFTNADLVVRTNGRIRSATESTRVYAVTDATLIGPVTEVRVEEGMSVRAGEVLVQMETTMLENELAKVHETIAAAQNETERLVELDVLIDQEHQSALRKLAAEKRSEQQRLVNERERQQSRVIQASAELRGANEQLSRTRKLVTANAASEAELTIAETAVLNMSEQFRQAKMSINENSLRVFDESARLLRRTYEVRKAQLAANREAKTGHIESAKKELSNLQIRLQHATVRSPIDGVIVMKAVEPGAVVRPGQELFEVAPSDGLRFDLEIPSSEIADVAVDMPVRIKLDAYDYQRYGTLSGRVCYVAPDSDINEASRSQRSLATYTVRIELLSNQLTSKSSATVDVKLGLHGTAEIITERHTLLSIMFRSLRRSISIG
jgi:HlyD family secretion protein